MIKKMRNRLAIINLILISIVLLAALIVLFSTGFTRAQAVLDYRFYDAYYLAETNPEMFVKNQSFDDLAVAIVKSNEVEILHTETSKHNKEYLSKIALEIVEKGKPSGAYSARAFKVYENLDTETTYVVFADMFFHSGSIGGFVVVAVGVLIISLICFMLICILLANAAIKPVEDSWNQQKQFIADASHELKTPLSVIMANTEIIASHKDETVESQMRWIENTRSESKKMANLVANLLFLAKHDDGLIVTQEVVNLSDLAMTEALSHQAVFYENEKEFSYTVAEDIKVFGNKQQINQLFTILLDNANKYSLDKGNINLKVEVLGKEALIYISNDANHLTEAERLHVFDRFFTFDSSRNKDNDIGGNGLGLAIATVIAETHNGKIGVENIENGVAFFVLLPLYNQSKVNKVTKKQEKQNRKNKSE